MKIRFSILLFAVFALAAGFFSACNEEMDELPIDDEMVDYVLGWYGYEDSEHIEDAIDLFTSTGAPQQGLPSSVDLTDKFPPIGNQGQYGTCVAWACAYNLKTYLEAQDQGYTSSQLADESYQFSPKDLFWSIPSSLKGDDCNGTGFEYALDQMVSRGVAKMNTVPYSELGDCSSSTSSGWDSEADQYKLENYREIPIDQATIKEYLSNNRPVVIGAQLGDYFMNWNSSDVISSDNDTYNGQHAYHAMIVSGYDDSKGASGAFRVVNSWGTYWGDAGYIWVDYDFFISQFCFAAFVATNKNSNSGYNPDEVSDVTGKDLVGWALQDDHDPTDYGNGPSDLNRMCSYNVYNVGTEQINASDDWSILYLYYNAYNADDYGIILYDYYSDDYGNYGEDGNLADQSAELLGESGNWWNYINVPSGESFSDALYGGTDNYFEFTYSMPSQLNGDYYLVMIADGFDVISEYDEANNYLYWTKENGDPWTVVNGVIDESSTKSVLMDNFRRKPGLNAKSPNGTARTDHNVNAYTPSEITQMIKIHYETGAIYEKIKAFKASESYKNQKRRGKK